MNFYVNYIGPKGGLLLNPPFFINLNNVHYKYNFFGRVDLYTPKTNTDRKNVHLFVNHCFTLFMTQLTQPIKGTVSREISVCIINGYAYTVLEQSLTTQTRCAIVADHMGRMSAYSHQLRSLGDGKVVDSVSSDPRTTRKRQ